MAPLKPARAFWFHGSGTGFKRRFATDAKSSEITLSNQGWPGSLARHLHKVRGAGHSPASHVGLRFQSLYLQSTSPAPSGRACARHRQGRPRYQAGACLRSSGIRSSTTSPPAIASAITSSGFWAKRSRHSVRWSHGSRPAISISHLGTLTNTFQ
jgi:hypothetical protein